MEEERSQYGVNWTSERNKLLSGSSWMSGNFPVERCYALDYDFGHVGESKKVWHLGGTLEVCGAWWGRVGREAKRR